jgi:hypothetical protein
MLKQVNIPNILGVLCLPIDPLSPIPYSLSCLVSHNPGGFLQVDASLIRLTVGEPNVGVATP